MVVPSTLRGLSKTLLNWRAFYFSKTLNWRLLTKSKNCPTLCLKPFEIIILPPL